MGFCARSQASGTDGSSRRRLAGVLISRDACARRHLSSRPNGGSVMPYIAAFNLKGGVAIEELARAVIAAVEDGKITAEEHEEIQKYFNKLNPSEQEEVTRALSNTHTIQSANLSFSTLQSLLSRGSYSEFTGSV